MISQRKLAAITKSDVFPVVASLHPKSFRVERSDERKYVCVRRVKEFLCRSHFLTPWQTSLDPVPESKTFIR